MSGKILSVIISLAVIIGVVILLFKLIGGAMGLVGSFFNLILGLIVVVALVAIVIWMFSYAKKNK